MALAIQPKTVIDVFTSSIMKRVYQWIFAFAILVTAFAHTNLVPFIAGLLALGWYAIAASLSDEGVLFSFSHSDRYPGRGVEPRGRYFTNTTEWAAVVGVPLLLVGMSTFLFIPFFYDYQVIDRSGTLEYRQQGYITTMNPFTDSIRNYRSAVTVTVYDRGTNLVCIGTTSDGRSVRAEVGAALTLPFEGLPAAHARAGNMTKLGTLIEGALCRRFADVVATYTIDTIPSLLRVEAKSLEERRSMNDLGVRFNGQVIVIRMHAYSKQND